MTELHAPEHLDALLPGADFVIMTIPHTPATEELMNRERLRRMKSSAFLIKQPLDLEDIQGCPGDLVSVKRARTSLAARQRGCGRQCGQACVSHAQIPDHTGSADQASLGLNKASERSARKIFPRTRPDDLELQTQSNRSAVSAG
jgi:hypothetical protein